MRYLFQHANKTCGHGEGADEYLSYISKPLIASAYSSQPLSEAILSDTAISVAFVIAKSA